MSGRSEGRMGAREDFSSAVSGDTPWVPVDASGAGLIFPPGTSNVWTRVGNLLFVSFFVHYPVTVDGSAASVGGLPFKARTTNAVVYGGYLTVEQSSTALSVGMLQGAIAFGFLGESLTPGFVSNASLSNLQLGGMLIYLTGP